MRQQARERLVQAKALIAKGDEDSIRYACLELRLAIEYISYQLLQAYLEEVPDEAMRKWTPRQVIEQMREVDPSADNSSMLAVGIEETYGVPSKEMSAMGEDRRFSLKWANSNHNALGNFLHSPTLYQLETGQAPSIEKMLKKASEITDTIQHILDAPLFNVNFGLFFEFECHCGNLIKRRDGSFKKEDGIKCPCHSPITPRTTAFEIDTVGCERRQRAQGRHQISNWRPSALGFSQWLFPKYSK